ncbi:MAG TPA: diaminopimelate epimerase [Planctomycetota bacterium]|nr:diaminopimelate epimerase [Planctomycetota bacterium]
MRVPFTKMEGAGNDYVYLDAIRTPLSLANAPLLARRWSDRHFGIGADGLIVMSRGQQAPIRMSMWNADGSRGAMCGNGLRCLARLAFEHGHVRERAFTVETDAGPRRVELLAEADEVRAWMGDVRCGAPIRIDVGGHPVDFVPGDAGNPHAVTFVADVEAADVAGIGRMLQAHRGFPGGVNVEFVQVQGPDSLLVRTFERGSGETLACGTGAVVAAAAARQQGRVRAATVAVRLRGGTLRVVGEGSTLAIEGPARTVFTGEIALPESG